MRLIAPIQYLRAVAALAVVVVHGADVSAAYSGNRHFGEVATIGSAGVDVFFVISGFIMYVTACARPVGGARFLVDRISRIVPLYWAATVLLIATVVWAKGQPPSVGYFLLSLSLLPADPQPVLGVGWTLVYEMFFYVLLAVSLAWRPHHVGIVTTVLLGLVAAGVALQPEGIVTGTYTSPLLLEFLAGLWLGVAWTRTKWFPRPLGVLLVLSGVGALAAVHALAPGIEASRIGRVVAWGVPALAIVGGTLSFAGSPRAPHRLGLLLGAASYAIYLTHPAVLVVLRRSWAKTGITEPWTILVVSLAGSAIVGVLCHIVVERRLVEATRRWLYARLAIGPRVDPVEARAGSPA